MSEGQSTLSTTSIRRFYDRLGAWHDHVEFFEGAAKQVALERLQLRTGLRLINAGCGAGKDQARLVEALKPGGLAVGVDISSVMARLTAGRTGCPTCQADIRRLPLAPGSFDRLLCSYVLDVLPQQELATVLRGFGRLLRPNGLMVLVALVHGQRPLPRAISAVWQFTYQLSPWLLGGCRPIDLHTPLEQSALQLISSETVTQLGVASQVIVAGR